MHAPLPYTQALAKQYSDAVPRLLVTEARDCVGGNIITRRDGGYQWEEGPNSFQPSDAVLRAAVDAGVADRLVLGDPKAPRYVYWGGRLRATPSGPDVLTFDLLSLWGKLRAGLGAAGFKAPLPEREESVKEFVTRNLGEEVFQRLIEPFCSGVYAGDPAKLSMKAAFGKVYDLEKGGGSIVGGVLALMKARKQKPPEPRPADLPPKPKVSLHLRAEAHVDGLLVVWGQASPSLGKGESQSYARSWSLRWTRSRRDWPWHALSARRDDSVISEDEVPLPYYQTQTCPPSISPFHTF